MKAGVLSDVHGFIEALDLALKFLERQGVDQILCCGDLVERGRYGDAVVDRIRNDGIPCVRGNHDQNAQANQAFLRRNPKLADLIGVLRSDTVDYLAGLPVRLRFTLDGVRVSLAHGTPWDLNLYVFPNSPEDLFRRIADEADADVVLLGHSHTPMTAQVNGVRIFNAGSVSLSNGASQRTCGVLSLPECDFSVYELDSGRTVQPARIQID